MEIIQGKIGTDGFLRATKGHTEIAVFMSLEQIESALVRLRAGQTATIGNSEIPGVGISLNLQNVEEVYKHLNR